MINSNTYYENGSEAIKADLHINYCEWANESFQLPRESTSEYGQYRSSRTPMVEEPLYELSPMSPTRTVIVIKPTQLAGTTMALIFVCGIAALYPGPCLIMLPNEILAKDFSTKKLSPSIKLIPVLTEKIQDSKIKNSSNTMLSKSFPGGSFIISGSNSEASYRSASIKYLILDDFDGFSSNIAGQGSPEELADRRTGTFPGSKVFIDSTTTIVNSNIELAFKKSSQGLFNVPCPHCGHYQYFIWGTKTSAGIKFKIDAEGEVFDAWYQCECCQNRIDENEKPWMFENGKYVHKYPNRKERGFKYNGLHTPLGWINGWKYIAKKFLEAIPELKKGNPAKYITWLNTFMAEPYEQKGDRKTEDIIKLKDDRISGSVPSEGVNGLVAGIDTQDNGFWYVIRGYGPDLESFLIKYGFVDTFNALEDIILNSEYSDAKGKKYKVLFALHDAMGHRTKEVYDFCRVRPGLMCAQGVQKMAAMYSLSNIDTYPGTNKAIPGGVKLLRVNTTLWKNNLATKILVNPSDPGAFHLHSKIFDDYLNQMTAEFLNDKGLWELPKEKPNHLWDCEYLALAAANYIGVQHFQTTPITSTKKIENKKKSDWFPEKKKGHEKKKGGWFSK